MTSLLLLLSVLAVGCAATNYVAEVYFVIEPQVIRNYMKLGYDKATAEATARADADYMVYQVNEYYKTLATTGYNLNVEVRKKGLLIMTDELFDACKIISGTLLQVDLALAVIRDWAKTGDMKNKIGYDMMVVWTGFDAFASSGSHSTTGYAPVAGICTDTDAIAIVEYHATQDTAVTTAHEIAHNLGADHDPGNPTSAACSTDLGYIMTPVGSARDKHRWSFSSCSARDIATHMEKLNKGKNCLTKTTVPASTFTMSQQLGQDIMDPQKICQRSRKDKNSYFCAFEGFYKNQPVVGDLVCQYLYCGPVGSTTCSTSMPTEGMVCDVGKRCDKGKCVAAPSSFPTPSSVVAGCVYGDIESGAIGRETNSTCASYITKHGLLRCEYYKDQCCATCNARMYDLPNCPYGDKSPQCASYTPNQICRSNSETCCYKCRNFVGKRSVRNASSVLPRIPRSRVPDAVKEILIDEDKLVDASFRKPMA